MLPFRRVEPTGLPWALRAIASALAGLAQSPPSPGQHPRSEFEVPAEEEINFISLPPGSQFKVSQD